MKKYKFIIFLILAVITLVSCANNTDDNKIDEENIIQIYYIDNNKTKLVKESYNPAAINMKALVKETLVTMQKEPKNISSTKAIPDNIEILDYVFFNDDRLVIDFSSSYNDLDVISEVLCRGAVVKTLSQIEGITYIEFTVGGQPLKDSHDQVLGLMTENDFIDSTSMETNYNINLYFADDSGEKLLEYNTTLIYSGTVTVEEMVIQALIDGPRRDGYYRTIPENTKVISVLTKEGIAYVNLDEKFLDTILNINDNITIYSIVNSLAEVPHINQVQFLINGETRKLYHENIKFDGFFERELSLIDGEK